jgi:hypothetical protein
MGWQIYYASGTVKYSSDDEQNGDTPGGSLDPSQRSRFLDTKLQRTTLRFAAQ